MLHKFYDAGHRDHGHPARHDDDGDDDKQRKSPPRNPILHSMTSMAFCGKRRFSLVGTFSRPIVVVMGCAELEIVILGDALAYKAGGFSFLGEGLMMRSFLGSYVDHESDVNVRRERCSEGQDRRSERKSEADISVGF